MQSIFKFIISAAAAIVISACTDKQVVIKYHFAEVEEGREIISSSDSFTKSLHAFDLESRLSEAGLEPSESNYLELGRRSVLEWSEKEIRMITDRAAKLQARIDSCGYKLPIPEDITLIKTSMVEEGGAGGYTRGANIFLASFERLPEEKSYRMDYILAHELFHVLTRHNADFRKAMYRQIGFEILDHEIEFPDCLLEMRISNPDVARYDSWSTFTINGVETPCTMWYRKVREYTGGPFFTYGEPCLLPLDADFKPVMNADGSPVIYELSEAVDFNSRIGINTDYVINPEEVLADNFAFALLDFFPNGNGSPELTERLKEVMRGNW